jgi:site-specific DNA-cytosine methylase
MYLCVRPHFVCLCVQRRAQTIPDWMVYEGSAQSREQQVGNAVPYLL